MSGKQPINRAQVVRQRRARMKDERVRHAGQEAYHPLPPVTTRGVAYVMPQKKKVAPRRFNFAVVLPNILPFENPFQKDFSGFHLTGNSISRLQINSFSWRIVSFLISLGLAALIYLAWTSPYFRVGNALVTGNTRLTAEEVNSVLGVANQSVFMLTPNGIVFRLRQNYPEVSSARVRIYFPNKVWVGMVERTPIIQWQQDAGYTWIDASGVAFKPRGQLNAMIPVIASGTPPSGVPQTADPLDPQPFISRELVDAIQHLAPHLPAGSTMLYNPQHGLGWKDNRGWLVVFGASPANLNLKLHIYYSLVDSVIARGIYPELISVEYTDAPYYRVSESDQDEEITFVSE